MRILAILILLPSLLFAQQKKYDSLLIEADSLFQKGEYEKASILVDNAFLLDHESDAVEDYFAARVYALTKNIDKSVEYFEKSLNDQFAETTFYLYDKFIDNIRGEKRYKELTHKIKNGGIDFFDIIADLESNEWVSYRNKKIFMGWASFDYENRSGSVVVWSDGLEDYSYQELLNRADLESFNFENSTLEFYKADFVPTDPVIPHIKLKKLIIKGCEANEITVNNCEIGLFLYGDRYFPEDYLNRIGSLYFNNSIIDSIRITDTFISNFRAISLTVKNLNLQIGSSNSRIQYFRIANSKIGFDQNSVIIAVYSENTSLENNSFDGNVWFSTSEFSKRLDIVGNRFNGYLDISQSLFPEFNLYFPYRQLKRGLYIKNTNNFVDNLRHDHLPVLNDYFASGVELGDVRSFEKLLNSHQYLFNNYRQRGELESANLAYVALKDLMLNRQEYVYDQEGGFRNLFRFRLAQLMKFYTNHGTDPSLALLLSFYLILIFAVFYFFFPSEWDTTSKARLISNFRDFRLKNDKGYIKPFFVMIGGFIISLTNAITLSLNSFVTLGFGTIPTTGIARYVCIIQGFMGWFLLSLFTVALINQVLS